MREVRARGDMYAKRDYLLTFAETPLSAGTGGGGATAVPPKTPGGRGGRSSSDATTSDTAMNIARCRAQDS